MVDIPWHALRLDAYLHGLDIDITEDGGSQVAGRGFVVLEP